jgi:hypothetical protein
MSFEALEMSFEVGHIQLDQWVTPAMSNPQHPGSGRRPFFAFFFCLFSLSVFFFFFFFVFFLN